MKKHKRGRKDMKLTYTTAFIVFTGLIAISQQGVAYDSRENRSYTGAGPGWTLDINNKSHAVDFKTSEETVSYKYPKQGPTVRGKGDKIIYFVRPSGRQMNVQVMNRACTDSAGNAFDTTVAVVLAGQGYWGCGSYK
jgi:hypothetical protein